MAQALPAGVHAADLRERGARTGRESQQRVAPGAGVRVAFQGRRRGAQQRGDPTVLGPQKREVARRVAQPVLLLEGGIVFLVDDHQAQLRERSEHRQPRADQHPGVARLSVAPGTQAFAFGQVAVQRGQRHVGEARAEAPDQLGGKVDLRDQDERLAATRQDLRDHREIDFGLAAAGHSPQEEGCEAAERIHNRAHTPSLVRGEARTRSGLRQGPGTQRRIRPRGTHAFYQSHPLELAQHARRRRRKRSQGGQIQALRLTQRGEDAAPGHSTLWDPRQLESMPRSGQPIATQRPRPAAAAPGAAPAAAPP